MCGTEMSFKVGRVVHIERVSDPRVQDFIYMWIDQESAFCKHLFDILYLPVIELFSALFLELFEEDIFEENLFVEKEQDTCN